MNGFFATFLPLILVAYLVSAGFGMLVAQNRGFQAVNRFWLRSFKVVIRFALRRIGRFFTWLASLVK